MNDPAQTTNTRQQMMQRMRSSFSQPAASPIAAAPQPAKPVVAAPKPGNDLPDEQKIALFEEVLDQVERELAQSAPAEPVAPPLPPSPPPQPVVSPAPVAPQPAATPATPPAAQPPVGSVMDQVLPQAVQSSDPLNPPQAGHSTAKERVESTAAPDTSTIDAGTGVQYVEQEKSPEIPVEVESYLKKVESHADSQPHEVVIADGSSEQAGAAYPSRPVIVLPITEEVEEAGQKKSPKFSVRWLVEWSHKVIKMFAGKVIYREA